MYHSTNIVLQQFCAVIQCSSICSAKRHTKRVNPKRSKHAPTPTIREIRNGCQREIELLNHAIESKRAIESKKISIEDLKDKKHLKLF